MMSTYVMRSQCRAPSTWTAMAWLMILCCWQFTPLKAEAIPRARAASEAAKARLQQANKLRERNSARSSPTPGPASPKSSGAIQGETHLTVSSGESPAGGVPADGVTSGAPEAPQSIGSGDERHLSKQKLKSDMHSKLQARGRQHPRAEPAGPQAVVPPVPQTSDSASPPAAAQVVDTTLPAHEDNPASELAPDPTPAPAGESPKDGQSSFLGSNMGNTRRDAPPESLSKTKEAAAEFPEQTTFSGPQGELRNSPAMEIPITLETGEHAVLYLREGDRLDVALRQFIEYHDLPKSELPTLFSRVRGTLVEGRVIPMSEVQVDVGNGQQQALTVYAGDVLETVIQTFLETHGLNDAGLW
ncbi:hypothetical protein CYMTET_11147 [Cymbomonas tetramitiformis]|uniref:Uncharacterized protein n=1 Tax=Cymbomonas tetramitiformis TaxID=36881 RepID=A0AAE0LDG1_9CHLO|nr:hypothetical protein CYMTET_11147 [Cymbomonas tetramitiformis]